MYMFPLVDPIPDDVSRLATLAWMLLDEFSIHSSLRNDVWQVAKDVHARNMKLRTESFFAYPSDMSVLLRSAESIGRLSGERASMLSYTNVGDCSWLNSPSNTTRVTAAIPLGNKCIQGAQFWVLASTVEQRMCVTVAFPSHVATMDDGRAFLQRSVDVMIEASLHCTSDLSYTDL